MTTIQLDLPVTTEVIADHLLTSLYDDALLEFILVLDEGVCDVGFTKKLIKKLKKTLKDEESPSGFLREA